MTPLILIFAAFNATCWYKYIFLKRRNHLTDAHGTIRHEVLVLALQRAGYQGFKLYRGEFTSA